MLINRIPMYMVLILCSIAAYILFNIKENVMILRSELKIVNQQVKNETDTIHVLKAELAYLTSPERLKALNAEYIALKDTKVNQLVSDPIIVDTDAKPRIIANSVEKKPSNLGWRYKKGPSKYLTMASGKK